MAFTAAAFKSVTRAMLLAGVLGMSSLAASPVLAGDNRSGLSVQIESARAFTEGMRHHNSWGEPYRLRCLTDREVVRGISAYGYERVQIVADYGGDRLELRAIKGSWHYGMRIDKCTGKVDHLERIGRSWGRDDGYHPHHHDRDRRGTGFGLEFQFHN